MEPIEAHSANVLPDWRAPTQADALPDDPVLREWLQDRGSLTRRLREAGKRDFSLSVLGETMEVASEEDRRLLDSKERHVRVRRVRLGCDAIELVFACTLMPHSTLLRHPWLKELGDQPLGEALADRDSVERTDFEYAWIAPGHPLLSNALPVTDATSGGLWARRSRFLVDGSPILVYEVFLPGLSRIGAC
jgi:chorismate--pyruvate lyase